MIAPRSLLVGAAGQVGAQMLLHLGSDRALPTSRTRVTPGWLNLDLSSLSTPSEAATLLDSHPLDAVYCIAGMTNVEACEDHVELAHATNARGPSTLATYARSRNLPFVYFSTEYIFDGSSGPYREEDRPNPISVYGRSKLAGEQAVREAHPEALILRTTVVYGPDARRKNYIYSLMSAAADRRRMKVPEDQISTPTYSRDLVRAAVELVSLGAQGVFHVCGPERLSRLAFARDVGRLLSLDDLHLYAVPTRELGQRASRPLSAGLVTEKLRDRYPGILMRNLEDSLADCREDLLSSKPPNSAA